MSPRTLVRIVLGAFMTFAGITHLTVARDEFQAQVPDWFPIDTDVTVLASGVAEIGLGASFLALPKHKRVIGILPRCSTSRSSPATSRSTSSTRTRSDSTPIASD